VDARDDSDPYVVSGFSRTVKQVLPASDPPAEATEISEKSRADLGVLGVLGGYLTGTGPTSP
jgi:hypothetical protein